MFRKKTWQLDGDRALLAECRSGGPTPLVDLYSYETTPEVYHLRIYPKEFDGLKRAIEVFMDYVEHVDVCERVQLDSMPVSILRGTDPEVRPHGGLFQISQVVVGTILPQFSP